VSTLYPERLRKTYNIPDKIGIGTLVANTPNRRPPEHERGVLAGAAYGSADGNRDWQTKGSGRGMGVQILQYCNIAILHDGNVYVCWCSYES